MPKNILPHIALFLVALIYGANYSIAKEVLSNDFLTPGAFITLRIVAGAILFWITGLFIPWKPLDRKDWGRVALCAFCGIAANQLLFFEGLKATTPIHAALIMTMTPILVLTLSSIFLGERITRLKVLGITVGAIGAILLITQGQEVTAKVNTMLGDGLVLLNATLYALYIVLVKKLMEKYGPPTILRWIFLCAVVMIIPFGAQGLMDAEWQGFPSHIWWAIAFVLIFVTFFVYLLNGFAISKVRPSIVSIYIYLQPLFASIIALSMGKDHLDGVKILAGMLIFIGVGMVSFKRKARKVAA